METKKYVCSECDSGFVKEVGGRGGIVSESRKRYCSGRCAAKSNNRAGRIKNFKPIEPRSCSGCGKVFTPIRFRTQKTCSQTCNGKVQHERIAAENRARRPESVSCGSCGKVFEPNSVVDKYCSRVCYSRGSRRKYNDANRDALRAKARIYRAGRKERIAELAKKSKWGGNWWKAMERDGFSCKSCQSTKSLVVHHLDGEGETGASNHALENLQVLCRTCHKKAHRSTTLLRVNGILFVKIGEKQYEVKE